MFAPLLIAAALTLPRHSDVPAYLSEFHTLHAGQSVDVVLTIRISAPSSSRG